VSSTRREIHTEEKKEEKIEASILGTGCPANGKFGEDIDQLDNCNNCKQYNSCAAENEEIEKKKRQARQQRMTQESGTENGGRIARRQRGE